MLGGRNAADAEEFIADLALLIETESEKVASLLESAQRRQPAMPEWLERAVNIVVGGLVLALLVKYQDRGILKRIGESKYRFRSWLRSHAK